jgi:hypothetical protein
MRVNAGARWFAPFRFRGACRRKQNRALNRSKDSVTMATHNASQWRCQRVQCFSEIENLDKSCSESEMGSS